MQTDRLPPWLGGIGVDEALKIGWMLEIPLRIAKIEDALFVTLAQIATSEERSDHLCLTSSKLSMFHAGLAREFAEFAGFSAPIGLELPDAGRHRLDDSIRAIGKNCRSGRAGYFGSSRRYSKPGGDGGVGSN